MIHDDIQNNKLQILGKLAASLAHEIRNPLSAIKLHLEFIKMSDMQDEVQESVEACLQATDRIQDLIESTLDFSRSSLNDSSFQSLNDVALLAYDIMNPKAKVLNVRLEKELQENIPNIQFNKNKILQVILNLVTNAFDAVSKHGTVKIKTYDEKIDDKEYLTLEIEDNGHGISEDDKHKIFNDFYTNKSHGTGLGLSVCKMILNDYNADMNFETEPGKGTKFFVRFNPK